MAVRDEELTVGRTGRGRRSYLDRSSSHSLNSPLTPPDRQTPHHSHEVPRLTPITHNLSQLPYCLSPQDQTNGTDKSDGVRSVHNPTQPVRGEDNDRKKPRRTFMDPISCNPPNRCQDEFRPTCVYCTRLPYTMTQTTSTPEKTMVPIQLQPEKQ